MKPSDQIKNEHQVIGKAISALLEIAKAGGGGVAVPVKLLREEIAFIHGFTEDCHHRKEEEVLFPALEPQLRTATHNPIPDYLRDHEHARQIMGALQPAVDAYEAGDQTQMAKISELAHEYSSLLIEHMRKENLVLIDLIENTLFADKKLEVAERFAAIEDELGPGYHEKFERLAEELRSEGHGLAA